MKIKIPIIGFIEKHLGFNFNVVKNILSVFRDPQDVHRVLLIIPLTLLVSHVYYFQGLPRVGILFHRIQRDEMILIGLVGFLFLFCLGWAILSSEFNLRLYVRQSIFVVWTALLHRLAYGLDQLGSTYPSLILFIGLTLCIPYAFMGLRPDQVVTRLKENHEAKKRIPVVVESEATQ